MATGEWISVFMALIAVITTLVAYVVFRSSTDPVVIVYAEPDLKRPSIITLVIENIGRGPAYGIKFSPSRSLPERAFSIPEPIEMPDVMESGPIVSGIPFLAPGQRVTAMWGQFGGLSKYIGNDPILVEAVYCRTKPRKILPRRLRSTSSLDVKVFESSEAYEAGYGPDLVKELKALGKTLTSIDKSIRLSSSALSAIVESARRQSDGSRESEG